MLLLRGDTDEAVELLEGAPGDFVAAGLAARARLAANPKLQPAFEAWDDDDPGTALELLQHALSEAEPDQRDQIR